ncbi:MAG: hypothetical protein JNM56_27015 [Planctomycetia bacterium]|nr:hypothetical protein [Planctomycetia bacterium]
MNLLQDWKNAKTRFEDQTKEKKPSEKFWKIFRKSSGLESACKALDAALQKGDLAGMKKALDGYRETSKAYASLLDRSGDDKSSTYKQELVVLKQALTAIEKKFCTSRTEALLKQMAALKQVLEKDLANIVLHLEEAESQYQLCDRFLRELHRLADSSSLSDKSGTQKKLAANGVQLAYKNLTATTQKMAREQRDSEKKFKDALVYWKKNDGSGLKVQTPAKSSVEVLVQSMNLKCNRAAELLEDGKQLLTTVQKVLDGQANAEQLYRNSLVKFVDRARGTPGTHAVLLANLGEDLGRANGLHEKIINETQDRSPERKRGLDEVRSRLADARKGLDAARLRIGHSKDALQIEWDHFPKTVREDPRYSNYVGQIQDTFESLDESLEKVKELETKYEKLRDKVGK